MVRVAGTLWKKLPQPWSTLAEGDEQPNWPRQKATQSMKVNNLCFSSEGTIS